jgi:lactoylglutathione lyase
MTVHRRIAGASLPGHLRDSRILSAGLGPGENRVVRIEHLALWTRDLERLRDFYVRHFAARAGAAYRNPAHAFESYFLEFDGGARLELMRSGALDLVDAPPGAQRHGLAHFAVSVGSVDRVDQLTAELNAAGYPVLDGPRRTGDGYYESVVLDPDGNRIEITA